MWIEGLDKCSIHAFRDEQGFSRLAFDSNTPAFLATYFEHDLQTLEDTELLYQQLGEIGQHDGSGFVFSGNSFTTTLLPNGVTIENDVLPESEPIEMSVEQYRAILDEWAVHLARENVNSENCLPGL